MVQPALSPVSTCPAEHWGAVVNTHLDKSSLGAEAERLGSLGGSNAHNKHFRGGNTNEEWRDEMRRVCGVKNEKVGAVER